MNNLKNCFFICLILLVINDHQCSEMPVPMPMPSYNLTFDDTCLTGSIQIGKTCQATLIIGPMSNNSPKLRIELFSSNKSESLIFGRPKITYGANLNIDPTKFQLINMISSYNDYRFTDVILDLDNYQTITDNGNQEDNSIKLEFLVALIDREPPSLLTGDAIWLSAVVFNDNQNQAWTGLKKFTLSDSNDDSMYAGSAPVVSLVDKQQTGVWGWLDVQVEFAARFYNLEIKASSNKSSFQICSIHFNNTEGLATLDANKEYFSSETETLENFATLKAGFVLSDKTKAFTIRVFYKILSELIFEGQSADITITVKAGFIASTSAQSRSSGTDTSSEFVQTVTYDNNSPVDVDLVEQIRIIPYLPVNINGILNATFDIHFPDVFFENSLVINVGDVGGSIHKVNICSVVPMFSGENLPCTKCMGHAEHATNDKYTWKFESLRPFQLRKFSGRAIENLNTLRLSIIAQVNTPTEEFSLPLSFSIGQIVSSMHLYVSSNLSFTNISQTEKLPDFSITYGDYNDSSVFYHNIPRPFHFDIITKPGAIYQPMEISILAPEIAGSTESYGKLCNIELVYKGTFANCVKASYQYYQRKQSLINDKIVIQLDSLCNTANSNEYANSTKYKKEDSLIRFRIYYTALPTTSINDSTLNVAVFYDKVTIYLGSIQVKPSDSQPMTYLDGVSTQIVTNILNGIPNPIYNPIATVNAGELSMIDFHFRTKPDSLVNYALKSETTSKTSSICSIIVSESGKNIQCISKYLKENQAIFDFVSGVKSSYSAFTGLICNTNREISLNRPNNAWDDDSVRVSVIAKTYRNASGTFNITLNSVNQTSGLTAVENVAVTVSNTPGIVDETPFNSINSSTFNSISDSSETYMDIYPGQTTILRFNITFNVHKSFNLKLNLASTITDSVLPSSVFEIQKFYVSYVGINYPCVHTKLSVSNLIPVKTAEFEYAVGASLLVGDLDYVAIDPKYSSSSIISAEAHVRLVTNSDATSVNGLSFTITPIFNDVVASSLEKVLNGFNLKSLDTFNSSLDSTFFEITTNKLVSIAEIKQDIFVNVSLSIPLYKSSRVKIIFLTKSWQSSKVEKFGRIKSLNILTIGRNVDGFKKELQAGMIKPVYSDINDTVEMELGVITNTGYGFKRGDYKPDEDDKIVFQVIFYLIDGLNALNQTNFTYSAVAELNSQANYLVSTGTIELFRNGFEHPLISVIAKFLSNTSKVFTHGTVATISMSLSHLTKSLADATELTTIFFFPPYVKMSSIECSNFSVNYTEIESVVYFKFETLKLDHAYTCKFNVTIDPFGTYKRIIQRTSELTGLLPPTNIPITYYSSLERYKIFGLKNYTTGVESFSYIPEEVIVQGIINTSLNNAVDKCPISSSVLGSTPENLESTGWTTGWRSLAWYTSGSTYVTISFKKLKVISRISINQLLTSDYNKFTAFKISYSTDGIAFIELPEKTLNVLSNDPITYYMPRISVKCRYLRIHITNISSDVNYVKQSGLKVNELYGQDATDDTKELECMVNTNLAEYTPRSFLYVKKYDYYYICDESTTRENNDCYRSQSATPNNWQALPKMVTTITCWIYDLLTNESFLYGVAVDKKNYLRSDDSGLTWKYILKREYEIMMIEKADSSRYLFTEYTKVDITQKLPDCIIGDWNCDNIGVYYGGGLKMSWSN